jgi:sulfonate transport system substrate-binding protein
VVPENSAIHSVADLKGKRVGLNKGSDVNYLLVPRGKSRAEL